MDELQDLLITIIAFEMVAMAGGMICLFLWFLVPGGRGRLLPLPRLRAGAWQGGEVAIVFLVMLFVPGLAGGFLDGIGFFREFYGKEPTSAQKQLWYGALAFPIIMAAILLILFSVSRTRARHLGLTTARWPQNIILGWLAWFPLTLLTLGLYVMVRSWIEAKEHPLTMLEKQGTLPEWLLGILIALVIAPFQEEIVFRGVLQGWLRRCSLLGHAIIAISALFVGSFPIIEYLQQTPQKPVEFNLGPMIFALLLVAGYLCIVLRMWRHRMSQLPNDGTGPVSQAEPASESAETIREGRPPLRVAETAGHVTTLLLAPLAGPTFEESRIVRQSAALAAIFGASMLWAIFHWSVWPTPIPLFFLGLGLGWLAYRTQSLVSPITVHILFNSVACVVLGLSVIFG